MKALNLLQLWITRVKCWLGLHHWLRFQLEIYTNDYKCDRVCINCGKEQHSYYDMSTGDTEWADGYYWYHNIDKSKIDESELIRLVDLMCIQSLQPDSYTNWEEIKRELKINRRLLKEQK